MQQPLLCLRFVARFLAWVCCAGLGLALAPVHAQTMTYAYRADTFAYDTPSGTATSVVWHTTSPAPACTGYPNGDDDWADVAFPGGFTFTFGGVSYNSVRVYSNGILAFPTDVSGFHRDYTSQALPITTGPGAYAGCVNAVPQRLMVAYWLDIVAGTANGTAGASVKYELLGTAPNRRFVISWVNVKLYNDTIRYNFQVVLNESLAGVNGNFKYQYTTGSSTGTNAAVGVQLTTTDFTQYAYNQNFIDTTLGTAILWYPANQLAAKSAEYRFDESSWSGAAGDVKDTSGNLQHATQVTTNVANVAAGKLCRGGTFTNNTSNATRDAIATPIVPASQGSVSLWYKSNNNWNAGASDAMLLDATTLAARPFFLLKRSTGALRFSVTDSAGTVITANTSTAYSYGAGTWHHIAVSWSLKPGTNQTVLQIILDGVLVNTTGTTPYRTTSSGAMAALSTLYIGDNRTSGITPSGGSPNGANGTVDEVYVYALDINATQAAADMALTRPTCTLLDHFHIVHDGTVSNCTTPASITIEAHDPTHALFSLSGTSMNLSTVPARGTWSDVAGGAISVLTAIGAGTGTASYAFAGESSVTFGLSNNQSEALDINVTSGAITEHTGAASACVAADYTTGTTCDASRSFVCLVPFGFNCVQSGALALNGHLYTKLANTPFSFEVVALKDANGDLTADGVETTYASDADKSVTVELVDGSGATECALRTPISPSISPVSSQTLVFQAANLGRKSTADMTVNEAYADLRCRVTDANQSTSVIACSTDNFAVRPRQFTLSSSNANADGLGTNNTATPMVKAGTEFNLTANTSTIGYGGTPTLDTSNASAHVGAVQTGAVTGTFGPAAPATGDGATGATAASFIYGEVGYFRLNADGVVDATFTAVDSAAADCISGSSSNTASVVPATLGKYGCNIGNAVSPYFGRFIPDHLDTAVTQSCGAFTYSEQPFAVRVTAMNGLATPTITQNYDGTAGSIFAKGVALSPVNSVGGTTIAAATGTLSTAGEMARHFRRGANTMAGTVAVTNGSAAVTGTGTLFSAQLAATEVVCIGASCYTIAAIASDTALTLGSAYGGANASGLSLQPGQTFTFTNRQTAPTGVFVRAIDSDSVSSLRAVAASSVEGGATVRSGRIRLNNAYGSELFDLPMTMRAEFWQDAALGWQLNPVDTCTATTLAFTAVGTFNTAVTCVWDTGAVPGNSGMGCTPTPATAPKQYLEAGVGGFTGNFNLWLRSPGAGNRGALDVTATVPAWLQFNWFGAVGNPRGRATFGVFRSPLIYRRENY